jgi:hypothetical protein
MNDVFKPLVASYPGYDSTTGRLTSPVLSDSNTVIGRSTPHEDGNAADTGGTPVGTAGTLVSDGDFAARPDGFEGPPGTREVHTAIRRFNLTDPSYPGLAVRSGTDLGLPSPGEVESKSGTSGDPNQDFPAESFFDVFVEIDLPGLGGLQKATLYNADALLVVNDNLMAFPPKVVYVHGNTTAVPVLFKDNGPSWQAGDTFGWLVLAGHGIGYPPVDPPRILPPPDKEAFLPANFRMVEYRSIAQTLSFPILTTQVKVKAENLGPGDALNVKATIQPGGANRTILDGEVTFGNIPVGGKVWSGDTYSLRYNLLAGVRDQDIIWTIEYDDSGGTHHVITDVPELPVAAPAQPLIPLQTMAYLNYPNPFNPETWIPYQLRETAAVTIQLYNPAGQLVRTLELGLQPPGFYLSRYPAKFLREYPP